MVAVCTPLYHHYNIIISCSLRYYSNVLVTITILNQLTPEKSKLVQRISTFHNDKISSFLLLFSVQWTFCRVDVDEQFTSRGSAVASRSVGISRKELGEGEGVEGDEIETSKASRGRRMGRRYPSPQPTGGSGGAP